MIRATLLGLAAMATILALAMVIFFIVTDSPFVMAPLAIAGAIAYWTPVAIHDAREERRKRVERQRRERDLRISELEYELFTKPAVDRLLGRDR